MNDQNNMVRREPFGFRKGGMSDAERVTRKSMKELAKESGEQSHEFLGSGGDQVVLEVRATESGKETSDLEKQTVIKLTQHFIKRGVLAEAVKGAEAEKVATLQPWKRRELNRTIGSLIDQKTGELSLEELETELDRSQKYEQTLRSHFPKDKLLKAITTIKKVPVSRGAVSEIVKAGAGEALDPQRGMEVPTLVRIQKRIPDVVSRAPDATSSIGFSYMERFADITEDELQKINDMAFLATSEVDLKTVEPFLKMGTLRLLEQAENDEGLRKVMQDFVHRAIEMANEGNEMIDIAGTGNVKFYKDDSGEWDYMVIDPDAHQDWKGLKEGLTKALGETISEARESGGVNRIRPGAALNGLNYARTMNILAKILRIPDRIQLVDFSEAKRPLDSVLTEVHRYAERAFPGERYAFPREDSDTENRQTFFAMDSVLDPGSRDLVIEMQAGDQGQTLDQLVIGGDVDEDQTTDKVDVVDPFSPLEEDTSETIIDF